MPPSPTVRCSPGRERISGNHIRGRSLEGPIPYRDKDDDLELFNEVQTKERDNFLLQSNDDFDDLFSSRLTYFSDYQLGIPKPSAGESSDLLNAEGEKNDYDWLLTPPDTPLFTSLDDETHPVCLPLRGRPRSQPISISRSSTMEKSHRSSRGSASPNRMGLSPGSSHTTTSQSRGRPSSLPGTSPPPSLHNTTPTRRSSPPPSKPGPRASTPSPRRMSTGSSSGPAMPSLVKGNSPAKSSGRLSSSPKIKAWQANIPGFSSEVPPNLRTSLGDRPASYVRGSSPAASRNCSKSGRQSMSPTASRSVGSFHGHERGKLSFDSKGSVASSGDDDVESLLSIPVSSSDRSSPRNLNTSSNSRSLGSSKKPTRTVTSSSAPKRSLDMAMRQVDYQKGPYNMFRPLLSSVPSSTIYSSKSGATQRTTTTSSNSSITNASSDVAFSVVGHGTTTEGSKPKIEDRASECTKSTYLDTHEEIFSFDQSDDQIHAEMPHRSHVEIGDETELDTLKRHDIAMEISTASEISGERRDMSVDDPEDVIVICTKCGSGFCANEIIEGEPRICKDCKGSEIVYSISTVLENEIIDTESPDSSAKDVDHISIDTTECLIDPHTINSCVVDEENRSQKLLNSDYFNVNSKADVTEGVGIPLLLRSSSVKGPVFRSRNFTASSMTFDDFSHIRDGATSTRSGHGTTSTSSSIDLGSSKQSETRFLRQLSGRKSDNGIHKSDFVVSNCHEENFKAASAENDPKITAAADDAIYMDLQERGEARGGDGLSIDIESNGNWRTVSDLSSSNMSVHIRDASMASASIFEDSDLQDMGQNPTNSCVNGIEQDASSSTHPEICPENVDVAETKEDDVASPDSVFDVGSRNSKCSFEDLQEPSHSVASSLEESIHQKHAQNILEESSSVILNDNLSGSHKRSFTLEEATDTILFCRSIVHDLAYEASNLAAEKDTSIVLDPLRPVVINNDVGSGNTKDHHQQLQQRGSRTVTKRNSKSQKPKQKTSLETDSKPFTVVDDEVNDDQSVEISKTRIVGANNNKGGDSLKPLKLESKCNCVIM